MEYLNNTRIIRNLPRHLLLTMFLDENLEEIRKNDFSCVSLKFSLFKNKGYRLYRKKKFEEAFSSYIKVFYYLKYYFIFVRY